MNWRRIPWRGVLRHRFFYVPASIVAVTLLWNFYISFHNDGLFTGVVVDGRGAPVADVEVIFFERNFVNYQEKVKARTGADGRYRFTAMQVHIGQLEARAGDGRRSERRQLNLWFRGQNTVIAPLVLRTS
jgi:hypothetical protein